MNAFSAAILVLFSELARAASVPWWPSAIDVDVVGRGKKVEALLHADALAGRVRPASVATRESSTASRGKVRAWQQESSAGQREQGLGSAAAAREVGRASRTASLLELLPSRLELRPFRLKEETGAQHRASRTASARPRE